MIEFNLGDAAEIREQFFIEVPCKRDHRIESSAKYLENSFTGPQRR